MLYALKKTCEFAEWKEDMIWDRIVVGMRDQALAARLIRDADLPLKRVTRSQDSEKRSEKRWQPEASYCSRRGEKRQATHQTYRQLEQTSANSRPQGTSQCKLSAIKTSQTTSKLVKRHSKRYATCKRCEMP